MDIEAVVNVLRLGIATSELPAPPSGDMPPWLAQDRIRIPAPTLETIVAVIRAQPDLVIFDDQMQQIGNHARRVALPELAQWLVRRAFAVGPDQVVSDLVRYVAEDRFPVEEHCLLSGINIEEETEMLEGLRLVPFDRLPDSSYKQMFTPTFWHGPRMAEIQPTAAIVCENRLLRHHGVGATPEMVPVSLRYGEMGDLRLILTLIGPSAPVILAFWSIPAAWVPLGDSGMTWSSPPEQGQVRRVAKLLPADVDRLRELHALFKALPSHSQQHLRVPLERLNRALRRSDWTDSAIELGIALEALFLNDQDDERTELTYRLRVRGARFLGSNLDERMRIDRLLRNVYRLRSVAVHTGHVPNRLDGAPPTAELLEDGYRVTARAIEEVIRRGGNPEWSQVTFA